MRQGLKMGKQISAMLHPSEMKTEVTLGREINTVAILSGPLAMTSTDVLWFSLVELAKFRSNDKEL